MSKQRWGTGIWVTYHGHTCDVTLYVMTYLKALCRPQMSTTYELAVLGVHVVCSREGTPDRALLDTLEHGSCMGDAPGRRSMLPRAAARDI